MANEKKSPVVHLRVYEGSKLSYNKDGSVQNPTQVIKFEHGTSQWGIFLKFLRQNGYADVKVAKVLAGKDFSEYKESDKEFKEVAKEVAAAFGVEDEKEVSEDPRDKRIAELEAQLKATKEGKKEDKGDEGDEESLEKAKARYKELYDKAPHPKWGIDKINKLIEEKELE